MGLIDIVDAKLSDVEEVYSIGVGVDEFSVVDGSKSFWSKDVLENLVRSEADFFLVAKDGLDLIGFSILTCHLPSRKATWENCYVLPSYRGKGVGGLLYEGCEKRFKELEIDFVCSFVEDGNYASRKMCENLGFGLGKKYDWIMKVI